MMALSMTLSAESRKVMNAKKKKKKVWLSKVDGQQIENLQLIYDHFK